MANAENLQKLMVEIAKMYYEQDLTQVEIASRLGISRPKVSRLLNEAKSQGIVNIYISDPFYCVSQLEEELKSLFSMEHIRVVQAPQGNSALIKRIVVKEAANYIGQFFKSDTIVGVGWGSTLYEIVKMLDYVNVENVTVAQLCGNLDFSNNNYADDIVKSLADKLDAKFYCLPCPAVVDNPLISEILMFDAKIKNILNLGKSADVILANIALPDRTTCLGRSSYVTAEDFENLRTRGAVGSICCRYYDIDGNICYETLDKRTIAIELEEMRSAKCTITCVADQDKAKALYGALRGRIVDVLVVDSVTANEVLNIHRERELTRV